MSGFAGWVDYGRDLASELPTVRRMADAVGRRGPDGAGEWAEGHAALAHRRLALLDAERDVQPALAAPDGRTAAALVFDGAIGNQAELRRLLASRGHSFRGRGDAEVVLHAYLEWGAECATRLEGIFAFAVWDARRQELVLTRDRLGVKPLCYHLTASGVLFGSEPKALLAHPAVEPVVGADGLRELFAHSKKPGMTVFEGIHEALPGHVTVVGAAGARHVRYWSLPAYRHTRDAAETTADVRRLLADAVASSLVADVPVGAMLSGGIDSSALTALAARALRDEAAGAGGRLGSYSVNFSGYIENFQPHPTMRATPDAPYAAIAAKHLGVDHTEVLLDTAALADPDAHALALRSQDAPSPLGDMDVSLSLFFQRLGESGVRAVLSGETADELFDGYFWAYDAKHSNSTTFPWVSFERGHDAAAGGLGCMLVDRSLRKRLDFIDYADQHYRDALAEVPHAEGEDATRKRAREVTYLALTRWAPTHLDRADRISMAHGVQLRPPFCDRALVEYVYNVPPEVKRLGGQEKGLLRAAVGDLLPAAVRDRRKSAYPTTQESAYGEHVRARFAELARSGRAAVRPLLDDDAVSLALSAAAPQGAFAWVERASMEMILRLETWLTEYKVSLRV